MERAPEVGSTQKTQNSRRMIWKYAGIAENESVIQSHAMLSQLADQLVQCVMQCSGKKRHRNKYYDFITAVNHFC